MIVAGTRPELVKLAPVALALRAEGRLAVTLCHSGQHPDLGDDILHAMGLAADIRLERPASTASGEPLGDLLGGLIGTLGGAMDRVRPRAVVVQGDTASTLAGALAAFHRQIPVAHVEAGLRSGDMARPWPEEGYRRLVSPLAAWHFAPTSAARQALLSEGIAADGVEMVGNTVVDALHMALTLSEPPGMQAGSSEGERSLVLATIHRRETGPDALVAIADALASLARSEGVRIVLPLHPRAESGILCERLAGVDGVTLTPPLGYLAFIRMLCEARLVVSDSGGVVEEATALGRPVLVLRDATERPEAVAVGTARLVGHDPHTILAAARNALSRPLPEASNVFGDGRAARRIAARLARDLAHPDAICPQRGSTSSCVSALPEP